MIIYLGSGKTGDSFAKFRFLVRYPRSVKECFNGKSIEGFLLFQLPHLKIFQNSASPIHKYPKPGFQISVTRSEIGNPGFGFQSKTRNSDFRDLINLYPSFCFFLAKVEFYIRLTLCKEIFFLIIIFKNYIKLIDGSQYDNNKIFKL